MYPHESSGIFVVNQSILVLGQVNHFESRQVLSTSFSTIQPQQSSTCSLFCKEKQKVYSHKSSYERLLLWWLWHYLASSIPKPPPRVLRSQRTNCILSFSSSTQQSSVMEKIPAADSTEAAAEAQRLTALPPKKFANSIFHVISFIICMKGGICLAL